MNKIMAYNFKTISLLIDLYCLNETPADFIIRLAAITDGVSEYLSERYITSCMPD